MGEVSFPFLYFFPEILPDFIGRWRGQMANSASHLRKIWYLRSYVPTSIFFVVRDRREPSKRIPGVIPFLEQAHGA